MDNDPDRPHDAINQSVIIEEIDMNGRIQKVYKKTYQLINGQTKIVTRIMHNWKSKNNTFTNSKYNK